MIIFIKKCCQSCIYSDESRQAARCDISDGVSDIANMLARRVSIP